MNQLQGFQRLYEVIKTNYRHENYKRVCELAETYEMYSTGDDIDDKLRQFSSRESDTAFSERKKVTVQICTSIVSNLTHIFYRVPRSNGVKFGWKSARNEIIDRFNNVLKNYAKDGFDSWCSQQIKDLIELDPNCWLVIENTGTKGQEILWAYPYIVSSENAIDYNYDKATLEYLIDKSETQEKNREGQLKETDKYTIYTQEGAVVIVKMPDNMMYSQANFANSETIPDQFNIKNDSYRVVVPDPYNLEYVPARCVGYLLDKSTKGNTYVNMYDQIVPILEKMLKVNSELDVTMCKHAHMQKIQYVRACPNKQCSCGDDGKFYITTENNVEKLCPTCGGKGYTDVSTGGLEYIYFPLPESKEDMIDLNNVVNYIGVPIDVATFQSEYLDKLIEFCKKVMYNSDIFSKQQVSETATEKILETENIYDTLYPYAINYANIYRFCIETMASLTDTSPIEIISQVNKDFKLLTKTELIEMLSAATNAGANEAVLSAINDEIAYSFYGDGMEYKRKKVTEKMLPFQNKTKEQQMLLLSQLDKTNPYYIAFMFGNEIINELSYMNPDFFEWAYEKQKQEFDKKADEIKAMLTAAEPKPFNALS